MKRRAGVSWIAPLALAGLLYAAWLAGLRVNTTHSMPEGLWRVTSNALRAFWMFSLLGAAPFGVFALMRYIFVGIIRARMPRDVPFVELPEIAVERSLQQPIAQRSTPWMRNNRLTMAEARGLRMKNPAHPDGAAGA